MKWFINILLLISVQAFSQETNRFVHSVYFAADAFDGLRVVPKLSTTYFQKFQPDLSEKNAVRNAAGEFLHIDETGIYIQKNKLLFVTREQVRESGKYEIRNGYLHGVVENDSVPTALEGENYYFLVPAKTYLYSLKDAIGTLYEGKTTGEFLLASSEGENLFSVIYLKFSAGRLEIQELDFGQSTCDPSKIKEHDKTVEQQHTTYVISPNAEEWKSLFGCFTTYDIYVSSK